MITLLQSNSWVIDNFVDNYLLHFVWFPLVLLSGLFLKVVIPDSLLDKWRDASLVNERNILNRVFGEHGFELFSVLYLMILFGKVLKDFLKSKYQTILPSTATTRNDFKSKSTRALLVVKGFALRYLTTFFLLGIVFYLRAFVLDQTKGDSGDGFNFSGHYFSLIAYSLSLIWEFHNSISTSELFELEDFTSTDSKTKFIYLCYTIILACTLILVIIWSSVLLATAIFYHTFAEKVIGLLIGYAIPVTVYLLLNRVAFMN